MGSIFLELGLRKFSLVRTITQVAQTMRMLRRHSQARRLCTQYKAGHLCSAVDVIGGDGAIPAILFAETSGSIY